MDMRFIQYLCMEDSTGWSMKHLWEMSLLRLHWKLAPSKETVTLLNSRQTGFLSES